MPDPETPPPIRPAPMAWKDRVELLTQRPQLTPERIVVGVLLLALVAVAAWFVMRTPGGAAPETLLPIAGSSSDPAASTTTATVAELLVAHAAGAVVNPGVYQLPSGARVTDLIDAAGGPTADADVDRLNLAAPITDGERVYVPRLGEVIAASNLSASSAEADGPLNLNTATLEQLDALPGIGPTTAKAIVDERERRGSFSSVDDLLDVRGIGPAKLEAIRELVTV